MHWGPTTDNLTTFLFELDGQMAITTEFWCPDHEPRAEIGVPFVAKLDRAELLDVLRHAVLLLRGASVD